MTQDELKAMVGQAALDYVVPGEIVGVGTGSTVNKFIDALATIKHEIKGAVSSSIASTAAHGSIRISPICFFLSDFANKMTNAPIPSSRGA